MNWKARERPWTSRESIERPCGGVGAAADRTRPTGLRRDRRGMSTGHAAVLILGLVTIVAGLYFLVAFGTIFTGPAIAVPVIGLILVIVGLSETWIGEGRRTRG